MAEGQARTNPAYADEDIKLGRLNSYHGYWLRRVSNIVTTHFIEAIEGTGMRPVLFAILLVIDENPGLNQGQLGRSLNVQRANMVSLIADLMERGLVERRDVPGDKRAFALHLTDQGRDMLSELSRRIQRHEEQFLARLDTDERAKLLDLLERIDATLG